MGSVSTELTNRLTLRIQLEHVVYVLVVVDSEGSSVDLDVEVTQLRQASSLGSVKVFSEDLMSTRRGALPGFRSTLLFGLILSFSPTSRSFLLFRSLTVLLL